MIHRRLFLGGLLAAPAIVRASSLMPVAPRIILPPEALVATTGMRYRWYRNGAFIPGATFAQLPIGKWSTGDRFHVEISNHD